MPILTPDYPCMNSSYNVGPSQLRRFQYEIQIVATSLQQSTVNVYQTLTAPPKLHFFHQHVHFLQVCMTAATAKEFTSWFGFCSAKLRLLIAGLESPQLGVQVHPFAKFFNHTFGENQVMASSFFTVLRFAHGIDAIDLKSCTEEFAYKVNSWEERTDTMDVSITHVLQKDLPSFVFDENNNETDYSLPSPSKKLV